MDGVVIPDNHIVTGLEGCRKTLHFYNKIREVLCEFVAEEELDFLPDFCVKSKKIRMKDVLKVSKEQGRFTKRTSKSA